MALVIGMYPSACSAAAIASPMVLAVSAVVKPTAAICRAQAQSWMVPALAGLVLAT